MKSLEAFRYNIKKLREVCGLSTCVMCQMLDIPIRKLVKLENGDALPDIDIIDKYISVFGLDGQRRPTIFSTDLISSLSLITILRMIIRTKIKSLKYIDFEKVLIKLV